MTAELVVPNDQTLFAIVDNLSCFQESLDMLDAQLAEALPDDERAEITQARAEVQASVEAIGAELAHKADAVAVVLRRLVVEREYIHSERTRLKARELATEKAEKWLRNYVVAVMQKNGMQQMKTAKNSLFLRNSEAADVVDVTKIPAEYMNAEVKLPLWIWQELEAMGRDSDRLAAGFDVIRVKAEPSLSTIKKAIKSGVEVPGADVKLNTSLVCR